MRKQQHHIVQTTTAPELGFKDGQTMQ